jgi:hypothetical protein
MRRTDRGHAIVSHFIPAGGNPTQANGVVTYDIVNGREIVKSDIKRVQAVETGVAGTACVRTVVFGGTVALGNTYSLSIVGWKPGREGHSPIVINLRQPSTGTAYTTAQLADQLVAAVNQRKLGITAAIGGTSSTVVLTAGELGPDFKVSYSTDSAAGTVTVTNTTAGVYPLGVEATVLALDPVATAAACPDLCARTKVWVDRFNHDGVAERFELHLYWGDSSSGASAADAAAFAALFDEATAADQFVHIA